MKRRTCLQTILAAGAGMAIGRAATTGHPVQLHVDLTVDPAKEKEMLHNFETIFRPAASKQPGYIDVKIIECFNFIKAIAEGRPGDPSFRDGYQIARISDAILASGLSQKWEQVANY